MESNYGETRIVVGGPNGGKVDYDATSEYDEEYLHEQFLDSLTEQERYDYEHTIKRVKVDSLLYADRGRCFTKISVKFDYPATGR